MRVDMNKYTDEFVAEWNGKVVNVNGRSINFDNRFGIQCMDLWNFWLEELGIPKGWTRNPDAAGVWENIKGSYYKQFDGILPNEPARKGDVFIYNRRAWGTGYGHIGIVLEDLGDKIKVFETNGKGDGYEIGAKQFGSPARIHIWPKTNLYGYLRYIDGFWPNTNAEQKVPPGRYWIVDPGDTLKAIADEYKMSVDQILAINPSIKDPNKIKVGQFIDIPEEVVRGWWVDPGDTVAGIAKHYGVTVDSIVAANGLDNPNLLHVGQFIRVP